MNKQQIVSLIKKLMDDANKSIATAARPTLKAISNLPKAKKASVAMNLAIAPVTGKARTSFKEVEHIQIPSVVNASGTNQYDVQFTRILSGIDNHILPTGSMAVDTDHKFNVIDSEFHIFAQSTYYFSFCVCIHVRENGKTALTNQVVAHSTSSTLEEKMTGILPDSGVGHDFRVISPWYHAVLKTHDGTNSIYSFKGQVDLNPILAKISREFWSDQEELDRIYDLIFITVMYNASQVVGYSTMLCTNGRLQLARDRIL